MSKYTCGAGTPEEAEANCTSFINGECTASWCEYRVKKQTNADRIRSMSDEELALFLDGIRSCSHCVRYGNNCFPHWDALRWLQQEAE